MFASNKPFPALKLVERDFGGEVYKVIAEDLEKSNILHRGLKRKHRDVEVAEERIPLTTIPKADSTGD